MIIAAVAAILPVVLFASAANAAAAKAPFYYGVWLPFWQSQNGASDISVNLSSLHEVSPFSYEMSSHGALIDDLKIGNGSWDGGSAPCAMPA